ncbi:MAG: aspartate--tRNA ligase [Negativicutes bacterium]
METMTGLRRTNACGSLSKRDVGNEVVLCGWAGRRRDHGGLIFVDMRDRAGIAQVVFSPDIDATAFKKAESIRNEYVLCVRGIVRLRSVDAINSNIASGEIEVEGLELRILNSAKTPPFYIQDNIDCDEQLRLKYRYLDLRRPEMQECFRLRHKVTMAMRKFLDQNEFYELETPILCKSTPEGARDYLVPSRVQPGKFFALPQSPQVFKQLFMVAGMERYYQIARCFRDEDLRADRQPEFTQLDIEMSFIDQEQILEMMEKLTAYIFKETMNVEVSTPFRRMSYFEAMNKYGSDKPDMRFEMPLVDISECVNGSDFKVYNDVIAGGGVVKCINVKGYADIPRRELDGLVDYIRQYGAKGMTWMNYAEGGIRSAITKFFSEEIIAKITETVQAEPNDAVLIIAGDLNIVNTALGALRLEMAKRRNLIDDNMLNFLWVVDFPMFEYDSENKRYAAMHHMFTSPKESDLQYLDSDPARIMANAYDLVLNGCELGGGSIRIYNRDIQNKVFNAVGMTDEQAYEKFGYMLDAFEYGAPPHGGIAFGLDRMIMLMAKRSSIRDVIAFPKTQSATDLMLNCPADVDPKQLRELYIKSTTVKSDKQ